MRGEPWLAPVLVMLWTAHRAVEAELYSLEVQACLSVVYKSGVGGVGKKWMGQQTSVNDSSSGNNFQRLAPASILQLTNAEDITVVDPKRPGNSFAPFVDKIMEYVSAAMGISYAKSVKDYSKGNFSSQRMGDADDRRHLRQVQNLLIDRFIRPVYNDFVRGEIISGRVAAPGFAKNPELYLQSNFTFEPYDYIQPLDDAKADTERIASGMKSFKDLLSENGKDWDEHFAQVAAERKLSEKLGIEFIYGGKEQKPVEVNGGNNAE
jgi:lambda family phage portal protein